MSKVMMQLTQPHHDADGNLVHQPGFRVEEGDALLAELPAGSFQPVIVGDDGPFPEHNTAEQPQRVTQPGPEGDGDQVGDDPKRQSAQPQGRTQRPKQQA